MRKCIGLYSWGSFPPRAMDGGCHHPKEEGTQAGEVSEAPFTARLPAAVCHGDGPSASRRVSSVQPHAGRFPPFACALRCVARRGLQRFPGHSPFPFCYNIRLIVSLVAKFEIFSFVCPLFCVNCVSLWLSIKTRGVSCNAPGLQPDSPEFHRPSAA